MSFQNNVNDKAQINNLIQLFENSLLYFFTCFILLISTVSLYGQDVQDLTEEEYQRFEQIRDSLIQEGFIQEIPQQLSIETDPKHPIIEYSTYQNKSLSVSTNNSRATDFNPDGTRFYVLGRLSMTIEEYYLSVPWEIETATFVRQLDISDEMGTETQSDPVPNGLYFRKDDGNKLWVFNRTEIWEYTLGTPWDISSAEPTGYQDLKHLIVRGHDIDFKPDGSMLFVDDRILETVFQFNLSNIWDVSSLTLDYVFDVSAQQEAVRGIQFNQTGDRLYLMDTGRQEILEYFVSSPYDLRSASFLGTFYVGGQSQEPRGLTFTPDYSMFYVTEAIENDIYHYHMTTVDPDESSVITDLTQLEADVNQSSNITVSVNNEHGIAIPGVEIHLSGDSDSKIESDQAITNNFGEAIFKVKSAQPQSVTYTATAIRIPGNVELSDKQTINFIPVAPVALSPTDLGTDSFTANWEVVSGSTNYILDVSEEIDFNSYVYQAESVGYVTDYQVSGLNPGKEYFYRIRAETDSLISKYSETIEVITFPEVPVVSSPNNVIATRFTAQWQSAPGAREYILDVSRDEEFEEFISGYENLNVGDQLSYEITELYPGSEYFYRVRSRALNRESEPSEPMNVSTVELSTNESQVTSSQLRAIADGNQEILVNVYLKDTDGNVVQGEKVRLIPDSDTSEIEAVQAITDEQGFAGFTVISQTPGQVNYTATIAETFEIGSVSLEFLPDDGLLTLGDNYPNPFSRETTIPVTVPERMQVRIQLTNILGSEVQTVFDDELETGYHEITADLSSLASGVYFYRLFTDQKIKSKKMILVK